MIVVDTGVLVAGANRRDEAHQLAAILLVGGGREIAGPDPVVVEPDHLLRRRAGRNAARALLQSLDAGDLLRVPLTARLFARAVEIDVRYAALDLGIVDASVMALAEAEDAPILTFDFRDFRATRSLHGTWRHVVSEAEYERAVRR